MTRRAGEGRGWGVGSVGDRELSGPGGVAPPPLSDPL